MDAESSASRGTDHDGEWTCRHPQLDRALIGAARAPAVDERFDEQVWALIRADEAVAAARQPTKLGATWWLDWLSVIAVAVTAVAIAVAARSAASRPVAEAAAAAIGFAEQPPDSVRSLALIASVAALWFGLRHVPFVRTIVRA